MDKNTLSQYGWVVIVIIVLLILIALATPFGNYVAKSVRASVTAFDNKVDSMFDNADINYTKPKFNNIAGDDYIEPSLILTNTGATYGTIIKNDITPVDYFTGKQYDGIVCGFDIDYYETPIDLIDSVQTYVTAENGTINIICHETQSTCSTGATIQLIDSNGEVFKEYGLIVFGDVDGDGYIDAQDASYIEFYEAMFDDAFENTLQYYASDVSADGLIDLDDSATVEAHGATLDELDPQNVLAAEFASNW